MDVVQALISLKCFQIYHFYYFNRILLGYNMHYKCLTTASKPSSGLLLCIVFTVHLEDFVRFLFPSKFRTAVS